MIPGDSEKISTDRLTPGKFAALLGLLLGVSFPQVVFGLETFFYRDFSAFGYPLANFHKESFWNGELPFWNPYNNCGLPFLAQWNTLTLYPLALVYLIFPLSWSLGIFCLGHLLWAGLGMNLLAYSWTRSRFAAAVAGMAFAFNGLSWQSLMWPNNVAALGWMPWVVLAMERARRRGSMSVVIAGLIGAAQILTGAPEIILQTWFLLAVLWAAELIHRETPVSKLMARAAGASFLVIGLAAAQLLPFLDLLAHSQRGTGYADSEWSMPLSGWANFFVPLFHCRPAGQGVYLQEGQYWTSSYFAGLGTIFFAALSLWRVRNWRVWVLAGVAVFSLMIAMGENGLVYPALKKLLPQIGFLRFPIKFVVLAMFALPLLAAYGASWRQTLPPADSTKARKQSVIFVVLLLATIAGIVWVAKIDPRPTERFSATLQSGIRSGCFVAVIALSAGLLISKRRQRAAMFAQAGVVVLLWLDVFTHMPNLSPTVPRWVYEPDLMRRYLKWETQLQPGQSRAIPTRSSLLQMHFHAVEKPVDEVNGRRLAFFDNLNLLDHVPKVDGFYSLYFREMNEILTRLFLSTNEALPLLDFLGVSHVPNRTNALEWVERRTAMPWITSGQKPIFIEDRAAFDKLFDRGFDPRATVYLPVMAQSKTKITERVEARILRSEFGNRRVTIEAEAAAPAMVVIAQAFYHPWHAYVDGAPTELWRANYAFQALQIPAGRHEVKLIYEDKMFSIGCGISLAALVACVIAWIVLRKRRASRAM